MSDVRSAAQARDIMRGRGSSNHLEAPADGARREARSDAETGEKWRYNVAARPDARQATRDAAWADRQRQARLPERFPPKPAGATYSDEVWLQVLRDVAQREAQKRTRFDASEPPRSAAEARARMRSGRL